MGNRYLPEDAVDIIMSYQKCRIIACYFRGVVFIFETQETDVCIPASEFGLVDERSLCYYPVAGSIAQYYSDNLPTMIALTDLTYPRSPFPVTLCRYPTPEELHYYERLNLV